MLIQYLIDAEQLFVAYSPQRDEVMIVRSVQPLTDEQRTCDFNHILAQKARIWLKTETARIWLKNHV